MLWSPHITTENGPFKVLLKRGEFIDLARQNRTVPYKLYYPEASAAPAPLIIWSHGFGGNCDGAAFLSRYIASHGYALLHITHIGTDSSLWEGKPGHPWDILRKTKITRETTLARFGDVPFSLTAFENWAKEVPSPLECTIDFERVGISGHSFGALTTQVMAGQLFPDIEENLRCFAEKRFCAGIVYSPAPISHLLSKSLPEAEIYGPIDIPLFYMTGTQDRSPIGGFNYERRLCVFEHTAHPEKHLNILQDGDHMVYNGTRGKLAANPKRELHEELIKVTSLAFWEAYLKENIAAKKWLSGPGVKTYLGKEATHTSKK